MLRYIERRTRAGIGSDVRSWPVLIALVLAVVLAGCQAGSPTGVPNDDSVAAVPEGAAAVRAGGTSWGGASGEACRRTEPIDGTVATGLDVRMAIAPTTAARTRPTLPGEVVVDPAPCCWSDLPRPVANVDRSTTAPAGNARCELYTPVPAPMLAIAGKPRGG